MKNWKRSSTVGWRKPWLLSATLLNSTMPIEAARKRTHVSYNGHAIT